MNDARAYRDTVAMLHQIMAHNLDSALYRGTVFSIFNFVNLLAVKIARLTNFYEDIFVESLPQDYPYRQIQEIKKGFVPHCWRVFADFVTVLDDKSTEPREGNQPLELQVSFVPPSIHQFCIYKSRIGRKVA